MVPGGFRLKGRAGEGFSFLKKALDFIHVK
jgi:hypothetical protein